MSTDWIYDEGCDERDERDSWLELDRAEQVAIELDLARELNPDVPFDWELDSES